jgi:hypothetical protein
VTLATRQPTGLPSWPIGLVAGVEGSGKSWKLAEASASPMIHRTLWIGCGEQDPDEYALVPGARFEIVVHDGSYRGILAACQAATAEPPGPDGEPNLIVFDSGSRFWHQLAETMQQNANERHAKRGKPIPDDGVQITMDLWNIAKDRWNHVLDTFKAHQGPTLITSRLELVTIVDAQGLPTKEKQWKVNAEKNLPYEVGFMVQMRASYPEADTWLSRVKSARYKHEVDSKGKPVSRALPDDWTIEDLWTRFGLAGETQAPQGAPVVTTGDDAELAARVELLGQVKDAAAAAKVDLAALAEEWAASHNGQPIGEASDMGGLELLRDDLLARVGSDA